MDRFFSHDRRLKTFWQLSMLTIAFNIVQLLVGFLRSAYNAESIRAAAQHESYFSWLVFKNQCLDQKVNLTKIPNKSNILETDPVVVGIVPMFFAETAVMLVVLAFAGAVLYFARHAQATRQDAYCGIGIAVGLFLIDQGRYSYTSIIDVTKKFFTWSSYCVHGDIGWLFDALGYVALYGTIALCVCAFVASFRELSLNKLDPISDFLGQKNGFMAVESTFSWLSYFGYAFLVIWVVFSGITPQASRIYALQAVVIYIVIFGFYFAVIYRYAQISLWHQKQSATGKGGIAENPVTGFIAPHGTKAVQTFIKLALPIIFFLSVWFKWIKPLAALGGANE